MVSGVMHWELMSYMVCTFFIVLPSSLAFVVGLSYKPWLLRETRSYRAARTISNSKGL
jgi:hypothetical protein